MSNRYEEEHQELLLSLL